MRKSPPETQANPLHAAVIDGEGWPQDIHVVKSSGLGLDEKAMEAVTKWRFKPALKDGQPVNVRTTIEVNFPLL
jgi:periplasmic protein TonB